MEEAGAALVPGESQPDDTCIAEPVAHANRDRLACWSGGELFDLRSGVAARGQIELIRLGEQLNGSRQRRVESAQEGADDPERCQKLITVACAAGQVGPLCLGLVFV